MDLGKSCGIPPTPIIPKAPPKVFISTTSSQQHSPWSLPPQNVYPQIKGRIHVFHSAVSMFYAPSDISSIHGMRKEYIQATSSWRKGHACYDTILVNSDPKVGGVHRFKVVHVLLFFSFWHGDKEYPCALIQWYPHMGFEPDE